MSITTVRPPVAAFTHIHRSCTVSKWDDAGLASAVLEVLAQADAPVLEKFIALFSAELQAHSATISNERASLLIRLIASLDERREEMELAENPARRAGIARVGEHFARKAQSGFSPHPLPEQGEDTL